MTRGNEQEPPRDLAQCWTEAKRRCRLSVDDVRKAQTLGLDPRSLIENIPAQTQAWKLPVRDRIAELYEERFPERTPFDDEIEEQDRTASERRGDFRDAACHVAREFGKLAFVERARSSARRRATAGCAGSHAAVSPCSTSARTSTSPST